MQTIAEKLIRKSFKKNDYIISQHAYTRMVERKISVDEIQECVENGAFFEN